jgi:hypothetical protein
MGSVDARRLASSSWAGYLQCRMVGGRVSAFSLEVRSYFVLLVLIPNTWHIVQWCSAPLIMESAPQITSTNTAKFGKRANVTMPASIINTPVQTYTALRVGLRFRSNCIADLARIENRALDVCSLSLNAV